MIYPYRSLRRGDHVRHLPLVPIEISTAMRAHIRVRALVDSGAEHTVFSSALAEHLKIEYFDREVAIEGVGGGLLRGRVAAVNLQLGKHRWYTDVIFADGLEAGTGLLGQIGFFSEFTVMFRYSDREMKIYKTAPRRRKKH